ncbi:hypothetical protein CTAYLR_000395 [Chrysophaeum taylorii]|uniref:50S ribosomal protein L29 n=1 Tax=Chrysophaeum taylorii TaxID=2483200 RepID=A0AAD7XQE0_9STRA|nr:hypothetical protein CTAYLR_000395 [Chrysophaeum taylorii]
MSRLLIWVALTLSASAFTLSGPGFAHRRLAAAEINYADMTVEALEEELRSAHKKMFEMRLDRQQSKRKDFKSSEYRKLKKKIAQIMPIFESKNMPVDEGDEPKAEPGTEDK